MGVIYLLRHGQAPASAYGRTDAEIDGVTALTALGEQQATLAGASLADRCGEFHHSVSGSLPRQRSTIDIALASCAPAPRPDVDPRWNEYDIDAILGGRGYAASVSGQALQALVDDALAHWVRDDNVADHGSETYHQYQRRCAQALEAAVSIASAARSVLVVSSAGTIAQVVAQVWGLSGDQWIDLSRTMINAGLTKLIVGGRGVSVVSTNEHGHLESNDTNGERTFTTFR